MYIRKILSTILVILWMTVIFCFSNQQGTGSSSTSKRLTMTIVNIIDIKNKIPEGTKHDIVSVLEPIIRKLAHYTIYIVLGILLINCFNAYRIASKKQIYWTIIIGILYASSDEIHQLLINGRSGKIQDVIIDSIGIITGIVIFTLLKKVIQIINKKSKSLEGGN